MCDYQRRTFAPSCGTRDDAPACPVGYKSIDIATGSASNIINYMNEHKLIRKGDYCQPGGCEIVDDNKMNISASCGNKDVVVRTCEQVGKPDADDPRLALACALNMEFKNPDPTVRNTCCSTINCDLKLEGATLISACKTATNTDSVVACNAAGINDNTKKTLGEECQARIETYCTANDFANIVKPECQDWCSSKGGEWCAAAKKKYCETKGAASAACGAVHYSCVEGACTNTGAIGPYINDKTCGGKCTAATGGDDDDEKPASTGMDWWVILIIVVGSLILLGLLIWLIMRMAA